MDLVPDESDVPVALRYGVVVARLAGGVVDKRAVVDDHVGVFRHENQYPGAGVDGAVGREPAAANGDAAVRADKGQRAFVADELASIDDHVSVAGHVSSSNHRRLHP